MRSLSNDFTKYLMYFVFSFFAVGLTSCSDDDDVDNIVVEPTGSITVEDNQTVTNDQITIDNVTVGQDSWVVAVMAGDETTNNFITEPEMVDAGSNTDVTLTFNDDVEFTGGEEGDQISIKLYADHTTQGTQGEWDTFDEPIRGTNNALVTETITVFTEDDTEPMFSDFDTNEDGFLDEDEIANTYINDFTTWDADEDGGLSEEEFANTTFSNTDVDDDDAIDEDEWNQGFASMYGNYTEETDFAAYDTDEDGTLTREEWMTGFAETEWYTTYDADSDASVTEDEWNTGLYNDWDVDGDGMIDEDEYNNYRHYVNNW